MMMLRRPILLQVGNAGRSTVVSTQGASTLRDNLVMVFGARTTDGLEALEADGPNGAKLSGCESALAKKHSGSSHREVTFGRESASASHVTVALRTPCSNVFWTWRSMATRAAACAGLCPRQHLG